MKRALVISAIVMFAVIMGMSVIAPALADRTPPAKSPGDERVPTITCQQIIESGLPEDVITRLLAKADC